MCRCPLRILRLRPPDNDLHRGELQRQRKLSPPAAPPAAGPDPDQRCIELPCRFRLSEWKRYCRLGPAWASSWSRSAPEPLASWRMPGCRPKTKAGISLKTARTIGRRNGAFAADLACDVGGNRYPKRHRGLWQECTIHILIRNPDQFAILVVEGPQNMRDIHHLTTLINKFPGQRRVRCWIQLLILNLDDRIRRGRDQ